MNYTIKLTKKAEKFLDGAGARVKKQIDDSFIDLIKFYDGVLDHVPDIRLVYGKYEGKILRLRTGKFRILFKMEKDKFIIIVIEIDSRKDIYKKR
jgi:mRNA-degrading endonuclease RelE of RelBE toxin-antitoxin system